MEDLWELAKKHGIYITEDAVANLASVFFSEVIFNLPKETKDAAIQIYKVLNFEYVESKEILIYKGDFKSFFIKDNYKPTWKITPFRLKSWDIDCIEGILNNPNYSNVSLLCPIFDVIGFILSIEDSIYKLHFVGSKDYEVWKEIDTLWIDDTDPEMYNWQEGTNWPDRFDLKKTKFDWKPTEEELKNDI